MQRVISVYCVAEVNPIDAILAGFLVSLICNKREKGVSNEKAMLWNSRRINYIFSSE